jgi:polysaccharide biosynthesis transport protein
MKAPIDATGLLPALLRSKRLILVSGLLTACLAFAIARFLPLQYASEGNLIVEHPASAATDPKSPSVLNGILTQVDVLKSPGLIRSSIRDLANVAGLEPTMRLPASVTEFFASLRTSISNLVRSEDHASADPDSDKLAYIRDHLTVEAKENSSVISVQFVAGAPDTAASVVNAIMKTYIATVGGARDAEVAKADRWIAEQRVASWNEVEAAEQRVSQFLREHQNVTEVQGALTSSIQLSKDQAQLALAQEELARLQASLDTVGNGDAGMADETLSSKSVQALKELEAKTLDSLYALSPADPRRLSLQDRLSGIRAQISKEGKLVAASIARNVKIARARVEALEATVRKETNVAQASTEAGATLRQLTSDLEAKRQLFVAFLTGAGQARLAAVQAPSARILFPAVPPRKPMHSFGIASIVFGFFAGVVGASGIVVLRSLFSMRINSTEEMAIATDLPVFGALPDFKKLASDMLALPAEPLVRETFRGICLAMRPQQSDGVTVLVTSSEISEGKTTVAAALARRFADDGFRVLLIDADLRRPQLAKTLKIGSEGSLESVLSGASPLEKAVTHDVRSGLDCLFSDGYSKSPIRSLSSSRFKELLATAKSRYDFVILDSAPVLHVADPILLASFCQHVLFVIEAGRVPATLVMEAIRRFPEPDRAKISTLLTRVPLRLMAKRDYYSGYSSC